MTREPLTHEVLYLVAKGDITIEKAAQCLETTPRRITQMLTYWSGRIDLLYMTMEHLRQKFPTKEDFMQSLGNAAALLGVTERQVRRLLNRNKIAIAKPKSLDLRIEKHENAQKRWEMRQKCAISYISGAETAESAAIQAECSRRQLYRWADTLLAPEHALAQELFWMTKAQLCAWTKKRLKLEGKPVPKGIKKLKKRALYTLLVDLEPATHAIVELADLRHMTPTQRTELARRIECSQRNLEKERDLNPA